MRALLFWGSEAEELLMAWIDLQECLEDMADADRWWEDFHEEITGRLLVRVCCTFQCIPVQAVYTPPG